MQVDESTLRTILEGSKQYVIPLYQRPYAWKRENWAKLWEDLIELTRARRINKSEAHFTGTLVLDTGIVKPELTQFLVVDGQQRLTTLSVLLAAISNIYESTGDQLAAKRIREQVLINTFASEENMYRLKPANFDQVTYNSTINGELIHTSDSKIDDAYLYFLKKLQRLEEEEGLAIQDLESAVLVGLKFVTITTKSEDNVYRIFESINNTGIDLTQADLIRNLVFMRLGTESQAVYSKVWLPLQKDLDSKGLESVFWIDSLWKKQEVRLQDTYSFQKELIQNYSSEELTQYLSNIKIIGDCVKELVNEKSRNESCFKVVLESLNRLDVPGAHVLIVKILYLFKTKKIVESDCAKALQITLSYLIRRAIAGVPVNSVGRTAIAAAYVLDENASETLHQHLSTGRKNYISDTEIMNIFLEEPLYAKRKQKTLKTILELIVQDIQNTEEVNWVPMTIEHVLPQNPTEAGMAEFVKLCVDEDPEIEFESLVDTIGNLTLTVYNSELSNSPFSKKRISWLSQTGVTSSQQIAKNDNWGPKEIRHRSKSLAEVAIKIWPGPDESLFGPEVKAVGARIDEVITIIPPGRWTTYGAIADVVGTASMVVGNRCANEGVDGAWRVLKARGRVSKQFRWGLDSPFKNLSPREVLENEGVSFLADGLASPEQYLDSEDIRDRLGED